MSDSSPPGTAFDRRRWFTTRAVVAHVALALWVPGCILACWWQVGIGLSGDSLGWVYSVMWPCFALFGTVFWWHFVHDDPDTIGRRGLRRLQQASATGAPGPDGDTPDDRAIELARAEAEDPELAAYNAYLAALTCEDRPSSWRGR
ncbi:MAG TPA: hypothetical protein VMU64_14200 [Acidimicrobiales bacterium]|nr:hypothetical protein [Acidimicrobiales bacterium]